MSERAKFEKWLTDLDARRSSTAPHVFDRVRADYSLRLEGVLKRLREHTTEMREHADNLASKLKELEDAEQNLADEKEENALRAEVGELSESEWDSFSRKAERNIAKLQEDQAAIAEDLERIRELLGTVDEPPKVTPPPVAPAWVPSKKEMDELEFLKSVVGTTPAGAATRPASPAASAATKPASEAKAEPAPEAKPAPALTPTPAASHAPARDAPIGREASGPILESKAMPTPSAGNASLNLRGTGSQEVPRTLKCAECGAMNYPSEWYCERCGAELVNI